MAKIETWLNCDLQKAVQAQALTGNVFSQDNNGNRILVRIFNGGQKATVSGSVTANCILADGSTVNVNGTLTSADGQSVAYVDIPQGVLLVPGTLKIAIKLTDSGAITTLAAIVTTVYQTKTDNVITPSQQIINDWNAEISAAIATQDAAIANQDTKIDDLKSALISNAAFSKSVFSANANEGHPPTIDNINIEIKAGQEFALWVTTTLTSHYFQVFAYNKDGTSTTLTDGTYGKFNSYFAKITAEKDIKSIGVFSAAQNYAYTISAMCATTAAGVSLLDTARYNSVVDLQNRVGTLETKVSNNETAIENVSYYPFAFTSEYGADHDTTEAQFGNGIVSLMIENAKQECDYFIGNVFKNGSSGDRGITIKRLEKGKTSAYRQTIFVFNADNGGVVPSTVETITGMATLSGNNEKISIIINWSEIGNSASVITLIDNGCLKYIGITEPVELIVPNRYPICGGIQSNVYYQNIMRYYNTKLLQMVEGSSSQNYIPFEWFARFTPADDASGETAYKLYFYLHNAYTVDIESPWIYVDLVPKSSGSGKNKKIILIGDSMTDMGVYSQELLNMFNNDVMDITLMGTRGSGSNKTEGRSGWRAYTYCRCANGSDDVSVLEGSNPFYNNGHFDFSKYMTDQGYSGVDYVFINLGTNDLARGNYATDADLKEYFDEMIESIHTYDTSIRVIVWLPPTRALYENNSLSSIDNALRMNKLLINWYSNKESDNLYLCPVYINIDPYHDYNYVESDVSSRNSNFKYYACTDNVHPATSGFYKIADMIYSEIKYLATLDN